MEESENNDFWMTTNRIETLVDGIFAIAMTLLVLSLAVPEIAGPLSETIVRSSLYDLIPKFYVFILSFVLLAVFWSMHHRAFHMIKKADNVFLWLNIIWLLFIVMVPFTQSLIGEYGDFAISHFIYNLNMVGIGLFISITWYYARKRNLVDENANPNRISRMTRGSLIFLLVAVLAVILTFIIPGWTSLAYFLILPLDYIADRPLK